MKGKSHETSTPKPSNRTRNRPDERTTTRLQRRRLSSPRRTRLDASRLMRQYKIRDMGIPSKPPTALLRKVTTMQAINYISKKDYVIAICKFCGKRSRDTTPNSDGEPDLWSLGSGWSEAPYPKDHIHPDGSKGSNYTCPSCNKKLQAGQRLKTRAYLQSTASSSSAEPQQTETTATAKQIPPPG